MLTCGTALTSSPDLTDQCLLEHAYAGEEFAFKELVHRYQAGLSQLVKTYLGSEDAQDVVQITWLQLYLSLPKLQSKLSQQPSPASIRGWLYRVARNHCIDILRKRKREGAILVALEEAREEEREPRVFGIADPAPLPEELVERSEELHRLYVAIQMLPPKFRSVMCLRYAEGLSFKGIGHQLQIPTSTAKTYYYRGCVRLRTALMHAQE